MILIVMEKTKLGIVTNERVEANYLKLKVGYLTKEQKMKLAKKKKGKMGFSTEKVKMGVLEKLKVNMTFQS